MKGRPKVFTDQELKVKQRLRSKRNSAKNPDYYRKRSRDWYFANKERALASARKSRLKRKYGITVEDRDKIMSNNGGMCEICSLVPSEHIDHDHATGMIRGALCGHCNRALGMMKDDPVLLQKAIAYLSR